MKKSLIVVFVVLLCFSFLLVQAEVLFEDNFDSHPDWSTDQGSNGIKYWSTHKPAGAPAPFDGYFSYCIWGPLFNDLALNTLIVNSSNYKVASGKAILWEQNWDNSPDWASPLNQKASGLKYTHNEAVNVFDASSFRHSNLSDIHILEISEDAGQGGRGKGLIYRFKGTDSWLAASLNLAFSDPDINWATDNIDRTGYEELWYTVWYKTPVALDFMSGGPGFRLWKAARFYAYNISQYLAYYGENSDDPGVHWDYLFNENEELSSHYIAEGNIYKKPFFMPSWSGNNLYWTPQYLRESDEDGGTSNYYNSQERNNYETHLIEGVNYWQDGQTEIDGIIGDLDWHCMEYHVKLNDLESDNDLQEVYVDGSENPISEVGNSKEMRTSGRKIQHVVLFDNYIKKTVEGTQDLYMDNMVLSTERVGCNYIIGGLRVVTLSLPDAILDFGYSYGLSVAGGASPYLCTLAEGDLPIGLSLDDCVISGIPTETGSFNFTIQVDDSEGNSTSRDFSLVVNEAILDCADVGGTCKHGACDGYNDCASLEGECVLGYCCSGSCSDVDVDDADLDGNGIVDIKEMMGYVGKWKRGEGNVERENVLEAIFRWLVGG